jgi:hypothetical protein
MNTISHARAAALLKYDPLTGSLTWAIRINNRAPVGQEAGTLTRRGYRQVRIDGRIYLAHRLAWFLVHGQWPVWHIDHINGVRDDNRLANLRDVPCAMNNHNHAIQQKRTRTGIVGVYPSGKRFYAAIREPGGKSVSLGTFDTTEEARAAYLSAKQAMHAGFTGRVR